MLRLGLTLLFNRNLSSKMSKNKRSAKLAPTEDSSIAKLNKESISMDKHGNIQIKILAKPGSKQNMIVDCNSEEICIQIAAPPVEGEANAELLKFLSKCLGLRKSDIALDKGSKSRNKVILISKGITTVDIVRQKMKNECEN